MKTTNFQPRHAWDKRLGLPLGSVEHIVHASAIWHKAQVGAVSPPEYWAEIARQLHLSSEAVEQLKYDYFSEDHLDIGLIDYIRSVRTSGHTVGLLSNDSLELLDKLRALDIANLFDPLVISAVIRVMKPDPAAYHAVLDRLERPAHETIFVDDRLENVRAAQSLGMFGIHYRDGIDLPAVLTPLLKTAS